MPKVAVRMYQPLWERVRDSAKGTVIVVFAAEKLHKRVMKALQKERARDKSFKDREAKLLIMRRRDSASITVEWREQVGVEAGRALAGHKPLFEFYDTAGGTAQEAT